MRFDTERLASILGFDTQTLSQEADTSYTGKHVREWTHTLKLVMDSTLANYYEKVDWGAGVDEEEDMINFH